MEGSVTNDPIIDKNQELLKRLNQLLPSISNTVSTNSISSFESGSNFSPTINKIVPLSLNAIHITNTSSVGERVLENSKITDSPQINSGAVANRQTPVVSSAVLQIIRPAPLKKVSTVQNTGDPSYNSKVSVDGKSNATLSTNSVKTSLETQRHKVGNQKKTEDSLTRDRKGVFVETRRKEAEKEKERHRQQCNFPVLPNQHLIRGYPMAVMGSNNKQTPKNYVKVGDNQHNYQQLQPIKNATSHIMKQAHMILGGDSTEESSAVSSAPLFERIATEEVQEMKAYARVIETQGRRLSELERIHDDLEARLEIQTKQNIKLEKSLEEQNQTWSSRCLDLEKDLDTWKNHVQVERTRNDRLRDQLNKKDKEIHKMMQRKYDAAHQQHNHRQVQSHSREGRRQQASVRKSNSKQGLNDQESPFEILASSGSGEAVRERNVANSLLDFFGM